jgi:chromosome segregation ATPase
MDVLESIRSWVLLVGTAIGLPGVIIFWLRDRRRINARADIEEATVPFQIRTAGATSMEAEVAAIAAAFKAERTIHEEALEACTEQLRSERLRSRDLFQDLSEARKREVAKDEQVQQLRDQVEELRARVHELLGQIHLMETQLIRMAGELQVLQNEGEDNGTAS